MSRRVAVFTSSRADFGPLGPVVNALDVEPQVELLVIATGTHVVEAFGGRLNDIRLSSNSKLEVLHVELGGTRPSDLGESYGQIAAGLSDVLDRHHVELLVLLGDRWELLAAAGAALIHGVPIAHLHGGETTEGAIDERIRHGVTKLADLHLCATEDSARRIRHLGEEPWRIIVTGAPGLDRVRQIEALPQQRVEELLGRPLVRPFGIVVYHPPTIDRARIRERARSVFEASAEALGSALVLYPGADPGAEVVIAELERSIARHPHLRAVQNLGEEYLPVLKVADVLVGNSSSGIIEAASLKLPVVDIGDRQKGRLRPENVVHVDETCNNILAGIRQALDETFRTSLHDIDNPYGDGSASARIVRALIEAPLQRLMTKPLMEPGGRDVPLDAMTIKPHATLRETMATIQRGRAQIAFLINAEGRLVGSISDGDVRRALLDGADLEDASDPYINRVPVVATTDDDTQTVISIMQNNSVAQLPVVDDQGRLVGVQLLQAVVGDVLDRTISGFDSPKPLSTGR